LFNSFQVRSAAFSKEQTTLQDNPDGHFKREII